MKKIVAGLLISASIGFSASTNWQVTSVAGKAQRTIALALGPDIALQQTTSTLNVAQTQGRGDLYQIMTLGHTGAAVSTINVITGGTAGDIVVLQTKVATEDVVVVNGSSIHLGASTRTLANPQDKLFLFRRSATQWDEVGFFSNN